MGQQNLGQEHEIVVIGAGGHAKVCIDVLRDRGWRVRACLVNPAPTATGYASAKSGNTRPDPEPASCNGVAVQQTEDFGDWLLQHGRLPVFVAIGDNKIRQQITSSLTSKGLSLPNAISPHAIMAPSVQVGAGALVMPGAVINADSRIGEGAIINTSASVDHDCEIGAFAHIAPACALAGGVRIGAASFCGIGSRFIPGVEIGDSAMVAAGAVVVGNHGAGARIAGVPARAMKV